MNEEQQHIIQFKYSSFILKRSDFIDDINIHLYKLFKHTIFGSRINIHYNNLHIYSSIPSNYYNYSFNLSNMLYKLHTPHYYSKIHQNKELI